MGCACSTLGGRREMHTEFRWGNQREIANLEDLVLGGKIIIKWVF